MCNINFDNFKQHKDNATKLKAANHYLEGEIDQISHVAKNLINEKKCILEQFEVKDIM